MTASLKDYYSNGGISQSQHHLSLKGLKISVDSVMGLVHRLISDRTKTLDVDDCYGQPEVFMSLFLGLDYVEHLRIVNCNLTHDSIFTLGCSLYNTTSLKSLRLSNDHLTEQGLSSLASGLKENMTLENLSLEGSRFFGDDSITALVKGLVRNKSILSLDLSNCSLYDNHIGDITNALRLHPKLIKLFLSKNQIMNGGQRKGFSSLLKGTNTLKVLDVSSQQLLDKDFHYNNKQEEEEQPMNGFILSMNELNCNNTLLKLNLSRNNIRNVNTLIETLVENTTLEELDLSYNKLDDTFVTLLSSKLKSLGLKVLRIGNNKDISYDTIEQLQKTAKEQSAALDIIV